MTAAGKKNRLKMKNPMKLCPFRPATRAGQKAMATQTTAININQTSGMAAASPRFKEAPILAVHPRRDSDSHSSTPHARGVVPEVPARYDETHPRLVMSTRDLRH